MYNKKKKRKKVLKKYESAIEESDANWAKSLEKINKQKQLDNISDKDKETLMKIPITLTYKYFDEAISVKKKVDDMHIGETLEMYKSIMVPIFGEKSYEDSIIRLSNRIKSKRI